MKTTRPTAYFVRRPSNIYDLRRPHLMSDERPYAIEKHIRLPVVDYVNFITDLQADRPFIEENRHLCRIDEKGLWRCLLVTQQENSLAGGVLVMSEGEVYPKYCAFVRDWDEGSARTN